MIYQNYVWIAEGYFTPTEVDTIIACANRKEWEGGRVGFAGFDPDGIETIDGSERDEIRRSEVKWLQHEELPQPFHEKLASAVEYARGDNLWNWDLDYFENFQFTKYAEQPNKKNTKNNVKNLNIHVLLLLTTPA